MSASTTWGSIAAAGVAEAFMAAATDIMLVAADLGTGTATAEEPFVVVEPSIEVAAGIVEVVAAAESVNQQEASTECSISSDPQADH